MICNVGASNIIYYINRMLQTEPNRMSKKKYEMCKKIKHSMEKTKNTKILIITT